MIQKIKKLIFLFLCVVVITPIMGSSDNKPMINEKVKDSSNITEPVTDSKDGKFNSCLESATTLSDMDECDKIPMGTSTNNLSHTENEDSLAPNTSVTDPEERTFDSCMDSATTSSDLDECENILMGISTNNPSDTESDDSLAPNTSVTIDANNPSDTKTDDSLAPNDSVTVDANNPSDTEGDDTVAPIASVTVDANKLLLIRNEKKVEITLKEKIKKIIQMPKFFRNKIAEYLCLKEEGVHKFIKQHKQSVQLPNQFFCTVKNIFIPPVVVVEATKKELVKPYATIFFNSSIKADSSDVDILLPISADHLLRE
jgi:hypothetical protein